MKVGAWLHVGLPFHGDSSSFLCVIVIFVHISLLVVPYLDDRPHDALWNITLERMTLLFWYFGDFVPNVSYKGRP